MALDEESGKQAPTRRIAPDGLRAIAVAVLIVTLAVSLSLPHAGSANGWEVLASSPDTAAQAIRLPSRMFLWFLVTFGVGFSMLALFTCRWTLAAIATAGCAVTSVFGMFAIWSRQTLPVDVALTVSGPGSGLLLGWAAVIVLTFHWLIVATTRTSVGPPTTEPHYAEPRSTDFT